VVLGDAFVRRAGKDGHHLWVVVSNPFQNDREVLILNLTSIRNSPFDDLSCVFDAGDHPWIRHPTFVNYYRSEVHSDRYLDNLVKSGAAKLWNPFIQPQLQRIWTGAGATLNMIGDHLQILKDQGRV